MVGHITFKNPKPIINIPSWHVTTKLVAFMMSSGVGHFWINLLDGSYKGLRERITRVASAQATTMGKTKRFGPHWRMIPLISVTTILGPALMGPETSSLKQLMSLPSWVADIG
jgi:hypothetical protein